MKHTTETFRAALATLTQLELAALRSAFASSKGNGHDFGWVDDVKVAGLNRKQLGGVLSSLTQKGILTIDEVETGAYFGATDQQLYLGWDCGLNSVHRGEWSPADEIAVLFAK